MSGDPLMLLTLKGKTTARARVPPQIMLLILATQTRNMIMIANTWTEYRFKRLKKAFRIPLNEGFFFGLKKAEES